MKKIPRQQIEWIVNRIHVSKTDEYVRAEIARRATGPEWTPAKVRQAANYAIKHHNRNRDLYARVMSGRL